jgi:hypothetical protein
MKHEARSYSQKKMQELRRMLNNEENIDFESGVDPDGEVDGIPFGDTLSRTHLLKDQIKRVIEGTPGAEEYFK